VPTKQYNADSDWRQFVLDNGWRASGYELAAVVGKPVEDVEQVRRTGACKRLAKSKPFSALFTLWHGRAPAEHEWPTPRKTGAGGRTYEWQGPELALLASLVGQLGSDEIARTLTFRLRKLTRDKRAKRTRNAVQTYINKIGLQSTDVVGGITTREAAREISSVAIINQAIRNKQLPARRVGRLWVIPHDAWQAWKAKRVFPPKEYVPLRSIREALAIRSDKLSEFCRMGFVKTATRCNPYGANGPSTQFGTWWIDPKVAAKLIADRRAGRPMPWHGKALPDNLRATFKLWRERKHPDSCEICASIWGKKGAPRTYEEYASRYPSLAYGAKRHLTRKWTPGLRISDVAAYTGCSASRVRRAIDNGALEATRINGRRYVSRTDATRWKSRNSPTGDSDRSWIALATARKQYLFTLPELRRLIAGKKLKSKTGTFGAACGIVYVARHQCAQIRERMGFTEKQAARRLGVTIPRLRHLLNGVDWRKANGIPLVTVQAIAKRLDSRQGYTIEEAAAAVGMPVQWVLARKVDGTIKVTRARWDNRRVYISEPMLQRLKDAKRRPVRQERFNADWLRLSDAAMEAGVSAATVGRWADDRQLPRRRSRTGWRYHRGAVRARARRYWRSVRFHRAIPPAWLRTETKT
jgi:excisionase family DNA binding protein